MPPLHASFILPITSLFFALALNDRHADELTFGVHHGTARDACQILACNRPGYLSTSRDPKDLGARVFISFDELLVDDIYYCYVDRPEPSDYAICLSFKSWHFPHNNLPASWTSAKTSSVGVPVSGSQWPEISAAVKARDGGQCRLSQWRDGRATAHILPAEHEPWLVKNRMSAYQARQGLQINTDSRNLFALRKDLRFLFDQAVFALVPKSGQFLVHFLQPSYETAALYHNNAFTDDVLSFEFLFARFAWQVIRIAAIVVPSHQRKLFKVSTRTFSGPSMKHARGMDEVDRETRRRAPKRQKLEGLERPSSNTVPWGPPSDNKIDADELASDVGLAKNTFPFFLADSPADPARYEELMWYPGLSVVERRKREYMAAHPNISAHGEESNCSEL